MGGSSRDLEGELGRGKARERENWGEEVQERGDTGERKFVTGKNDLILCCIFSIFSCFFCSFKIF